MMFALRQMMPLTLEMSALPNDVALLVIRGEHRIIAAAPQHRICEANTSYRRGDISFYQICKMRFVREILLHNVKYLRV
jgi:hypothetical protein